MTAYEKVISEIHSRVKDDIIRKDIARALLCPETTIEEISCLFSSFWVSRYIEFDLLGKCIELYAKNKIIIKLFDPIGERAKELHGENPSDLETYAFGLVISTNGYERFMGRHLWDEFEMEKSDLDILSLPEEIQTRFAISILQDLVFPQRRLKSFCLCLTHLQKTLEKFLLIL